MKGESEPLPADITSRAEMERERRTKLLSDNYFDATSTIRHYDTLRVTFSSLSLSALALMAGFLYVQVKGGSPETVRALGVVSSLVALISVIVVVKLSSLIARQRLRARFSVRIIEEEFGAPSISRVDREVRETSRTWLTNPISLSSLW